MQFERYFRLADRAGGGVCCNSRGLFVGETALLERADTSDGHADWRPRPLAELNRDLARAYGLPVEFAAKAGGLAAVARALGRGDLAYAQIATLLLQIPDPPSLTKADPASPERLDLARALQAGGLLNRDWDPAKHPRWPAHSPDSVGGRFAPRDGDAIADAPAPVVQAQVTLPLPFDIPAIEPIPLPSEIVPPIVVPDTLPRSLPQNPYPSRPECVREWDEAREYCQDLKRRGVLGKGDYRGMGNTIAQCIMGRVSEACGGNSTSA